MAQSEPKTASISTDMLSQSSRRQLHGTSFLTLEHVGYLALTVVLPAVLVTAIAAAMGLWWTSDSGGAVYITSLLAMPVIDQSSTSEAVMMAAALLVLSSLWYVLWRRTSAEYQKRPGYSGRIAYKLPIYTALALAGMSAVGSLVLVVGVVLDSLLNVGVSNVDIGELYRGQFLPAFVGLGIFMLTSWYLVQFAKGNDKSKVFVGSFVLLSLGMSAALLITSLSLNHDSGTTTSPIRPTPLRDYYNDY